MKFIDTHCHVHFEAYKSDMYDVVERSVEAGVAMITVGTQTTTSENAIKLAEQYPNIWASVGLHPNHLHAQCFYDADELPPEKQETGQIKTRSESFDASFYEKLVQHPKVVAVGECGLDYYRIPDGASKDDVIADQKKSVAEQLSFASKFDKPVIIHCRDAHEDQITLLKHEIDRGGLSRRGVIHSFTGTAEDAESYKKLGFYLGLNGILSFSKELQDVIRNVPLSQLLLETDSPYLSPHPYRGKRNEPICVKQIADIVAELHDISVDEVARVTTKNAENLFNILLI